MEGLGQVGSSSIGTPLISPGPPRLRLKEIVALAVVCLQAWLSHDFDIDFVIAERVVSGAAVAEAVL
jgi:hypothetical protein